MQIKGHYRINRLGIPQSLVIDETINKFTKKCSKNSIKNDNAKTIIIPHANNNSNNHNNPKNSICTQSETTLNSLNSKETQPHTQINISKDSPRQTLKKNDSLAQASITITTTTQGKNFLNQSPRSKIIRIQDDINEIERLNDFKELIGSKSEEINNSKIMINDLINKIKILKVEKAQEQKIYRDITQKDNEILELKSELQQIFDELNDLRKTKERIIKKNIKKSINKHNIPKIECYSARACYTSKQDNSLSPSRSDEIKNKFILKSISLKGLKLNNNNRNDCISSLGNINNTTTNSNNNSNSNSNSLTTITPPTKFHYYQNLKKNKLNGDYYGMEITPIKHSIDYYHRDSTSSKNDDTSSVKSSSSRSKHYPKSKKDMISNKINYKSFKHLSKELLDMSANNYDSNKKMHNLQNYNYQTQQLQQQQQQQENQQQRQYSSTKSINLQDEMKKFIDRFNNYCLNYEKSKTKLKNQNVELYVKLQNHMKSSPDILITKSNIPNK